MASYRSVLANVKGVVVPRNTLSDTGPSGYSRPAGASEFCTVEDGSRPRRPPRVRSNSHRHMDGIQAKRDPITDYSNDELASDHEPEPHQRQARPNGTVINSHRIIDGADPQFFPKHPQPAKGKKRKNPASDIDDDELAESRYHKPQLSKPPRRLGNSTLRVESHSISRRGAIAPTKFISSSPKPLKIRVKDAVCQQTHLLSDFHTSTSPNGQCFLKPYQSPGRIELCAFRDDGARAVEVFDWLKIGSKITRLGYNEDSEVLKITQSQEAKIGQLMLLQFSNAADANTVVSWMGSNLASCHISYEIEESAKLTQTFNRQKVAIKRENRAQRNKAHDSESRVLERPSEPQHPNSDVPGATRTLPREANGDRVLLRDRMQVSNSNTEEQPPHRPAHQMPSQPSSVRSRPRAKSDDDSRLSRLESLSAPSSLAKHDTPRRGLRSRQTAPDMYAIEDDSEPEIFPPRWSESHPDWSKSWRMPLTLRRTTVDAQDIPRLDEGEYLNDNLIDFGLQYLLDKAGERKPDLLNRIYIFNTFFYTQLRKSGKGKNINFDGVKSWTSRVDIFSYDYIIVPVNENMHWWLAIICNARKLDPSSCNAVIDLGQSDTKVENEEQDKSVNSHPDGTAADISQLSIDSPSNTKTVGEDGSPDSMLVDLVGEDIVMKDGSPPRRTPEATNTKENEPAPSRFPKGCSPSDFKILTLDSLGLTHVSGVTALKTYLIQELRDKKKKEANELTGTVGMKANHIPGQNNHCDCGVFLLGYVKEFLQDPDQFVHTLLRKDRPEWTLDAEEQRESWRNLILIEQKSQQDKAEQAKQKEGERKREAKRSTLTPPTPPVKKKTKPEPCVEKSYSSPLVKEVDSGLKKDDSPMDLTTPVKDTKLPSGPHTASPTPTEKKTAPVSIDLSSPVAKEKMAGPSIDLSSPLTKENKAGLRPTPGHKTASRPKTATPPPKQARELSTPPPKGIKDSPRITPATIGRSTLAPPPVTTTATPKDGDKDQDKDDSFQEVSPTNFYKTDRTRHRSHPPSSPARPTSGALGISNPHRPQTQPPSSPARPSGMTGYATLQSPPPPHNHLRSLRSPRQHQQQTIPPRPFYTGSTFMLAPLDDDLHSHSPPHSHTVRAQSSVPHTHTHTQAFKRAEGSGGGGMIDLTAEDSIAIKDSIEGRDEPGAI